MAEKLYTANIVADELALMLIELKENPDILWKGQLFESRPYTSQYLSVWFNTYSHIKEIRETIEKINDILQTRNIIGALTNKLNSKMVQFNLTNNYGWKDTKGIEHTGAVDLGLKELVESVERDRKSREPEGRMAEITDN